MGAANLKDLKIYVNPGHGGHDSDDRNVAVPPFKQGDPEGYWESNSNLVKGLDLRDMLQKFGAGVMMSRTTIQPPTTVASTKSDMRQMPMAPTSSSQSTVTRLVRQAAWNQPLMLYRGFTNDPVSPEAKEMSLILNKQLLGESGDFMVEHKHMARRRLRFL